MIEKPNENTGREILLALIALVLCCGFGVVGCSGGSSSDDTNTVEDTGPTPEQLAAQMKEARKKKYQGEFRRFNSMASKNPEAFDDILQMLEHLKFNYQNDPFVDEIERRLKSEQARFEKYCNDKLAEVSAQVDVSLKDGDFAGAEEKLDRFLADQITNGRRRFLKMPARDGWEKKKEEIQHLFGAEIESSEALTKATEYADFYDYAKAVAILDSYPNVYKDTPYYAGVEEASAKYYALYLEEKAERQKKDAVPWEALEIDEFLSNFYAHSEDNSDDTWKAVDGTIEANNESSGRASLVAAVGDDWVDFEVTYEVKAPGQKVSMGLRRHHINKNFFSVPVELANDEWTPVLVRVRDGKVNIVDMDTNETLVDRRMTPECPSGGFAFTLLEGEELFLRNFKYRVLLKVEEEDADTGDEEDEEDD